MHSIVKVFVLALVPGVANAQNTSAPNAPALSPSAVSQTISGDRLTIITPLNATITFEADARDSDLLGIVKDVISSLAASAAAVPPTAKQKAVAAKMSPVFYGLAGEQGRGIISNILKDVRHLHIVSYDKPPANAAGTGVASAFPPDAIAFHEQALTAEGGRRLLYSAQDTRLLIMGFDAPRGMALVVDDGSTMIVART